MGLLIKAITAILEDNRSYGFKSLGRSNRKDMFVQRRAFQYVVQRLVDTHYGGHHDGPNVVYVDRHDDAQDEAE